jgi:DNA-binding transcriptional regulator YbjK
MGAHPRRQDGRIRRDALLKAAVQVAGEQGAGATTHRAVAARAGVPLAATSYYFDSIGDLLAEAMRTAVGVRAAELQSLALSRAEATEEGPPAPGGDSPDAVATRLAAALSRFDRTASLAQMEAYLHAARSSQVQAGVGEALATFEAIAEAALQAAGARRAGEGARAFVALADGFLLHRLANPRADDERQLTEAFRALFIAYAMDDDERKAWDQRLAAVPAPRIEVSAT